MEFLLNFNTWFKNLPAAGKISLFLVIVGMAIAVILLQSHYTYTGYQYLFTNLSLTDANQIAEKLQSMNIQAKIEGDAVLVPGNKVLELRNQLAAEGLPRGGGIGYEIFDKKNFGETEFQQRVNYIRAIQGELARTITAIEGVEKARVHIVMPEKTLFQEDAAQPTASVAISLLKGRKLSDAQVNGIVHLVLTSVEGLNESNLNVIDQNGTILFKGSKDDKSGLTTKQLEIQSSIEQRLEQGVKEMVDRVVGPGGSSIRVSAELNLSAVEKMVESVDPESRVAVSENVSQETSAQTGGSPGGVPGAAGNLPGAAGGAQLAGRNENSKKTETTTSYLVSKTTQKILEPVGQVKKLSVAVLVDGTYTTKEDGTKEYQPRSPEDLTKITELVKKAVGFTEARGDELKIENIQFSRVDNGDQFQDQFVKATNASRWNLFLLDNAKLMGIVLILGIVFFMLVKLVNSYAPPVHVAYANLIGQEAAKVAEALPQRAQVNIINRNDPAAKDKMEQMARQLPEASARMDGGEINFVESSQKSITVEQITTSEEKLRLQAAKIQCEQLIKGDVNEAVSIVRAWMNEG